MRLDAPPRCHIPLQFAVGKFENTLLAVLRGSSDQKVDFGDLRHLLSQLGFEERIKGGHFIFSRQGIVEIINLQPVGSKAKAYQVQQVRSLINKYQLAVEEP